MTVLSKLLSLVAVVAAGTILMATPAPAQNCSCASASLMGANASTKYSPNAQIVNTVITNGVELQGVGPALGLAGPRWDIDFGVNTIKIKFIVGPVPLTYPAGSYLEFNNLNASLPTGCTGSPVIMGTTVTTTKANPGFSLLPPAWGNGMFVYIAGSAPETYYGGEIINVVLKFGCPGQATPTPTPTVTATASPTPTPRLTASPTPTPTLKVTPTPRPTDTPVVTDTALPAPDPCCPPWNSALLRNMMSYQGSGGIGGPYTLTFTPTTTFNTAMTAYVNYLHAVNPAISTLNIVFGLYDAGTGTTPAPGPAIGSQYTAMWSWSGAPVIPSFFPANQMVVNHWYRINTMAYLNNRISFFSDKCANVYIDVMIQVQGSFRVLRTRTQDGRISERRLSAASAPSTRR